MIECRAIHEDEASGYLRVLCRIFDLDYARAESVFYHEPFFDLERKWALFENGAIRSLLTTVPLQFGDGPAIGFAGVGTLEAHRGKGFGQRLVEAALGGGGQRALLFAQSETLYARCGFEVLDSVVRAPIREEIAIDSEAPLIGFDEVRDFYETWARKDRRRLVRDEKRWGYWKWNLRMCAEVPTGYLCQEGESVRECVWDKTPEAWPVYDKAEWLGLRCLADELELPLGPRTDELMLMGIGFSEVPRLFMTDQF